MAKTVVGSYDSLDEARRVVDDLERDGYAAGDINLIGRDAVRGHDASSTTGDGYDLQGEPEGNRGVSDRETTASSVATGAVTGGVVGGAAGLLASLAGIAVPGIGTLIAAGPIVAALAGAGVGAVAGGLIGALRDVGVPHADAEYYAEAVRRGGALVALRVEDARAAAAAELMRRHGAVDIESRVAEWRREGWLSGATSGTPTGDTMAATSGEPMRDAGGDRTTVGDELSRDPRIGNTEHPAHASVATGLGSALGAAVADAIAAPMAGTRPSDQQVPAGSVGGNESAGSAVERNGSSSSLSNETTSSIAQTADEERLRHGVADLGSTGGGSTAGAAGVGLGGTGLPQTSAGDDRRLRDALRREGVPEDEHAYARAAAGDRATNATDRPASGDVDAGGDRSASSDRSPSSERPAMSERDGERGTWARARGTVREGRAKAKDAAERATPGDSDRDGR